MKDKTLRIVNILYVLFITNIISIIYLLLGLLALTVVPVIHANIKITTMLFDDEIDGYSGVFNIFNSLMVEKFKSDKKCVILTGIYLLVLNLAIIMMQNLNLPIGAVLNYFFIYLHIMIDIFWAFNSLYVIENENPIKYVDALALMFMNPKNLIVTIFSFILIFILAIWKKVFLAILAIAILSAIFVKINRFAIKTVRINR